MKLIIGLGNPGKEYLTTRHNAGFMFLDQLAGKDGFKADKKNSAEVLKTTFHDKRVILAKPTTFMNDSGVAVQALLHFYKLTPNDLIVIHDDKDVPLGEFRIQRNRGSAGHNGVQSIFDCLGTKDFVRLRLGVATETQIHDTVDFVLGKFTPEENKTLHKVFGNIEPELIKLIRE